MDKSNSVRENKTKTIKIYDYISLKLNNKNKIRYKPINKNLTKNKELRYLSIHDRYTKETMKIFKLVVVVSLICCCC